MPTRVMVLFLAVLVAGCGHVSSVGYPDGNGKYVVMRTMSDPHAMSSTVQRNWLEMCSTKTHNDYTGCVRTSQEQFVSTQGYIAGIAGPMLYSGAAAYAGYAIGQGLKGSGDTVNNGSSSAAGASARSDQKNMNNNESFNDSRYQWK